MPAHRAVFRSCLLPLILAGTLGGCAASGPPIGPEPGEEVVSAEPVRVHLNPAPLCYSCFWDWQEPGFRAEYLQVMRQRRFDDRLLAAELQLTVARVAGDSAGVCAARQAFAALAPVEQHPARRLLALETVAFTAGECGRDVAVGFRAAADAARLAGQAAKADIYLALAADTLEPVLQRAPIERRLDPPRSTSEYVLGASTIRVDSATRIVSQMERVARDWLSYQLKYDFEHAPPVDPVLQYHEGARLLDVREASGAVPMPATGTLAIQVGNRWFAADSHGVFRFEVLNDKVMYATTRYWHGVALLVDTHGISALVDAAARQRARLVVGCGDYSGKMEAAAYLAAQGIDVYFPTDRFVGEVLGYQGSGTLLGSAPVRREGHTAVIGDRPVAFSVRETVVVENTAQRHALQYYDAPRRYFQRLARALPLRLVYVTVDGAGEAGRVVERARRVGARAIALRVWTEDDYAPVRAWLAESSDHRAVLFHSIAYEPGVRLFDEFPGQTTFGDPRPQFR